MKIKSAWMLLLLSLMMRVGCTAEKPLRAATPAEMNKFIKLYREGDERALRRDLSSLNRDMTANFTARSLSGKISDRAEFLRFMASFYHQIIKFNASTSKIENSVFVESKRLPLLLAPVTLQRALGIKQFTDFTTLRARLKLGF